MLKGLLLVTGLVLLVGSGCSGGDGSEGDSAAGTHTNGGGEQATKADLDAAYSSIPGPHALGYTLQGRSSGEKPIDSTDWSPSEAWTAGQMISTMNDLLVYGRALGTGKGLLSPQQQSVRLGSFVSDVPPLNQPPLKGDLPYGIGLGKDHGWIGHNVEIPGYNTYLFYHPELDAVVTVEVNSDISSGNCSKDVPTMNE